VSAEPEYFQAVSPVLSAFFTFLAEKGHLSKARDLAGMAADLDEEIVAASQDKGNWGMAKSFAMAAIEAGVEPTDQKAMDQFLAEYNAQLFAQMPRPSLQAPPPPPIPLPASMAPVRRTEPKVGRNDPCPCGSGQKYKKCCGS